MNRRALLGLDLDDPYALTLTSAEIADAVMSLRLDALEDEQIAKRSSGAEAERLTERAARLRALAEKLQRIRFGASGR